MSTGELLPLHCEITRDLGALRTRVRDYAADAGLSGTRLDDLIVAVNEAAANVLEHGGGAGGVLARRDAEGVWVEVVDTAGTLTAEHLHRRPNPLGRRGYGLWLVRRLCDQVLLDHPGGRSRLRLHMRSRPGPVRPDEPTSPNGSG
ncbi:ATP-binding protein [Nonomuraea sp. MTCD27]|uniref:ATP-binding protein n=1 Tax=Nonomuraea sp. MTCD27 TaxID=1676747 RepID=UPI0035C0FA3D